MGRSRRLRPAVEALESKLLLSDIVLRGPDRSLVSDRQAAPISLDGRVGGTFRIRVRRGDPAVLSLRGTGRVSPLGQSTLVVQSTIDLRNPPSSLDATLANRRGSLTLRLTSDTGRIDLRGGVQRLQYSIVGGTGAFAGATGSGPVDVNIVPGRSFTSSRFSMAFRGA